MGTCAKPAGRAVSGAYKDSARAPRDRKLTRPGQLRGALLYF